MEFIVEDGTVVDVKGGTLAATIRQSYGEVAKKLKAKDRESVWTVAEFGFGMNPNAHQGGWDFFSCQSCRIHDLPIKSNK